MTGQSITTRLVISSVAGGVGSVAGGGKFANGAITGAFGYLFNAAAGRLIGGYVGGGLAGLLGIESQGFEHWKAIDPTAKLAIGRNFALLPR